MSNPNIILMMTSQSDVCMPILSVNDMLHQKANILL